MNQPISANPFPASAVARFSSASSDLPLTVTTQAVERATTLVDEYLASGSVEGAEGNGRVVAVVGEYGTGKTHLALSMLHRVAMAEGVRSLYLDAPADTFLSLYKQRFIAQLSPHDLRRTVDEYFADIVADDLSQSELTRPMASRLRDRTLDPHKLVESIGLMESRYRALLAERLTEIATQQAEPFAVALSLFMRAEFEAAVWEWLRGNPPDPTLVERGVDITIDSDAQALQAMGVIAHLFGGQKRRFVVVIDEMEKILGDRGSAGEGEEVYAAFKRMLEIFEKSGALLILCGLPDFLESLPDDARQRISVTVQPTRLMAEDAVRFIEDVNEKRFGKRTVKPFTSDVAGYLADLSGGNARRLVRLCYHAYSAAAAAETGVTRAIVREAAREQFEIVSLEDLRRDIARVIMRNGWKYEENRASDDPRRRVDYWIPVRGGGCAVIVAASVLQQADARTLEKWSDATVGDIDKRHIRRVLVVNGYLGDEYRPRLEVTFDVIVTHNLRTFGDDLDAALQGQIARDTNEITLSEIAERLDQSQRQNARLSAQIELMSARILEGRDLELAVRKGLTGVFASFSESNQKSEQTPLDRLFDEAEYLLQEVLKESNRLPHERYFSNRHVDSFARIAGTCWLVQNFRETITEQLASPKGRTNIAELCQLYDLSISRMLHEDVVEYATRTLPPSRRRRFDESIMRSVRSLGRQVYELVLDSDA